MRIAILGASGQTGIEAVKYALADNHRVTALVRDTTKVNISHPNLSVELVNIFDTKSLSARITGHDAIMSCLGFKPEKPVTGYLEATKAVVAAMQETNVKRLVVCHSWYTDETSRGNAPWYIRWLLIPMIKTVLDNMWETEKWLEENGSIDYTVVRPAGLTNSPSTAQEFKVSMTGYDVPGAAGRIPRVDVARFMMSTLENEDYFKKQVSIGV